MFKKRWFSFLIVAFYCCFPLNAQYRLIQANTLEDDFLTAKDLKSLSTHRFVPQSKQNVEVDSHFSEFSNRYFSYFSWNNPEYFGKKRLSLTSYKWIKKIGEESLLTNPNRFFSWESEDKQDYFVLNPVIDFSYSRKSAFSDSALLNGRGAEIYGQFGDKFTFYSTVMDYQADYRHSLDQYKDSQRVYPGIGKFYRNSFKFVDYFYATGYVSGKLLEKLDSSKKETIYQIVATFGHDKQFIGNGMRSLILSDFAPPSLFLNIQYKLGPFKYQNLFKELIGDLSVDSNKILNKKYLALHRGSLEFKKIGLELGLTEMIVQSREGNSFDVNYFNPIIFYRAIERDLGSGDNALIALDAKYTNSKLSVYSQMVLDEFNVKSAFTSQSYLNKFGFQLGLYYKPEFQFLECGYLNLEFNQVRPYTYSHWSSNYYSSYNQSLAHPMESNFREILMRIFVQPKKYQRWTFRNVTSFLMKGFDKDEKNYGSDIRKNYYTAVNRKTAEIGQGEKGYIFNISNEATYFIMPNLMLQLTHQFRNQVGNMQQKDNYLFVSMKFNFTQNRNQQIF